MSDRTRAGLAARVLLTAGALAPYWRLLTMSVVFVTDGAFASDLFNGELPGRILVGQLVRGGHLPLWTTQLCSGYPLAGAPSDPLGLALFALLPPAPALDLLLVVLLLIAAHGTYALARRFGANRSGAVLAGLGFTASGYIATQLQHLSIMSTIVWLPVGLILIDRLLTAGAADERRRMLLTAALALLYANQVLAGFPQSAYICALVYGSFALFRAMTATERLGGRRGSLPILFGIAAALALGAAAGAVVLFPLAELAGLSDRAGGLDYHWATFTNFWPWNALTFFVPYINGDASDLTYIGPPPFWENYGYVGGATVCLAVYGALRERRRALVMFLIVMTAIAFAFILGPRTPVYYAAYVLIPGMQRFRAPTRFLLIVELGLVLLAALGLTRLSTELRARWRIARWIGPALCVLTALDLGLHQSRQNAFVPAADWLAPPHAAAVVRGDNASPRTFTPRHRDIHRRVHAGEARGWTNVKPFFHLRELLEPDTGGGYWNVPSADCYVGLAPRWYVMVWSYHYYENAIVHDLALQNFDSGALEITPPFVNLLRTYGVTHMLSPYPGEDPGLTLVARDPDAYIYSVEGAARVRVVRAARRVPTEAHAAARLRQPGFDPDREILLLDAPPSVTPQVGEDGPLLQASTGRATITREDPGELVIQATAPEDGFLLLADTYYPGWQAQVDGVATPIYRANISVRGIALPKGEHTVRFVYEPLPFFRGLRVTVVALFAIFVWLGAAAYRLHV